MDGGKWHAHTQRRFARLRPSEEIDWKRLSWIHNRFQHAQPRRCNRLLPWSEQLSRQSRLHENMDYEAAYQLGAVCRSSQSTKRPPQVCEEYVLFRSESDDIRAFPAD